VCVHAVFVYTRSPHAPCRAVRALHLGHFSRCYGSCPGVPRHDPRHSSFLFPLFFLFSFSFFFLFLLTFFPAHGFAVAHPAACQRCGAVPSVSGDFAGPAAALAAPAAVPRGNSCRPPHRFCCVFLPAFFIYKLIWLQIRSNALPWSSCQDERRCKGITRYDRHVCFMSDCLGWHRQHRQHTVFGHHGVIITCTHPGDPDPCRTPLCMTEARCSRRSLSSRPEHTFLASLSSRLPGLHVAVLSSPASRKSPLLSRLPYASVSFFAAIPPHPHQSATA
jgi:hypothetical protein